MDNWDYLIGYEWYEDYGQYEELEVELGSSSNKSTEESSTTHSS